MKKKLTNQVQQQIKLMKNIDNTNLGSFSISLTKSSGKKCSDKRTPDVFQQRIQRPRPFTDNTGQEKFADFGHDDRKSIDELSNKCRQFIEPFRRYRPDNEPLCDDVINN